MNLWKGGAKKKILESIHVGLVVPVRCGEEERSEAGVGGLIR